MDEKIEGEQQSQAQNPIDDISQNNSHPVGTPGVFANQPNENVSNTENPVVGTVDETAEGDYFQTMSFWSAVIFGFVMTLLNAVYGLGIILFIVGVVMLSNRKNNKALKGLVIGFFSIYALLLLACGTCFLSGSFF